MEEKLISKKKPFFKISAALASFLKHYERWIDTPVCYDDLLRFSGFIKNSVLSLNHYDVYL